MLIDCEEIRRNVIYTGNASKTIILDVITSEYFESEMDGWLDDC